MTRTRPAQSVYAGARAAARPFDTETGGQPETPSHHGGIFGDFERKR